LLLHDVVGHELTEIAALTGASVAAVQSRLVRGRHELMERLGNAGDTEGDPR
jgi:DNA-directed RNA polymerase specialized sigma24 family protein